MKRPFLAILRTLFLGISLSIVSVVFAENAKAVPKKLEKKEIPQESSEKQLANPTANQTAKLEPKETAYKIGAKTNTQKIATNSGYTINYNNVSILEYIRFVSKICNINFLFNEADLNFNVTVVSEEPITASSVMATLIQILRIHGLILLEQDNSLVIHTSADVKQFPKIVTSEEGLDTKTPIVTRVFKVKNAKVDSLAAIIRPMISKDAILEVSPETRHLIITDVTPNIKKIAELIATIDSPQNPLEIETYKTKTNAPDYLISLATQILAPLMQGNPLILVPQDITGVIFIVSTPQLIERAVSVLNSLDQVPQEGFKRSIKGATIFVYKIQNRSASDIMQALQNIAQNLQETRGGTNTLVDAIQTLKYIKETNSLLFTGTPDAIEKLKEILLVIDIKGEGEEIIKKGAFFIYKPLHRGAHDIENALKEISVNLKSSNLAEKDLLATIQSAKIIESNKSLLFTGDPSTFTKIKELLAYVDIPVAEDGKILGPTTFLIYKPQYVNGENLIFSLKDIASSLEKANLADPALLKVINEMQWIPSTNSIIFTGDQTSLKKIESIIHTIDLPENQKKTGKIFAGTQFFIYKPKHVKGEELVSALKDVAVSLKKGELADPSFLKTIEKMQWVSSTNSLVFTGDSDSLKRVEAVIKTIDLPAAQKKMISKPTYFLYKLQHMPGNIVQADLDNFAAKLKAQNVLNPDLVSLIENIKWVKETNSLLLTGTPSAIDEAKELISKYDVLRKKGPTQENFYMYKPEYVTPEKIQQSLKDLADNLQAAGLADPDFILAINSMKYVASTRSIVFTGNDKTLKKIQDLIKTIDLPPAGVPKVGKATFFIYKVKIAEPQKMINALQSLATDLQRSGTAEKEIIDSLMTVKYVQDTGSLLFTGTHDTLVKVQPLVEKFDNSALAPEGKVTTLPSSYYVYKPQYLSGPALENSLLEFESHLKATGYNNPDLYSAIESVKWVEKTNSLIISGNPKSVEEIRTLLQTFDVQGKAVAVPLTTESIQPIDNVSFLVYKLQFHRGDEIQIALRQIAKEMMESKAAINQNLLNAINSIQWIQVTNSLLTSGDHETVSRLKDLIKSLDIPLKQVFIEILVIETTFGNLLTFGLDWGGKFLYKNRMIASTSNFPPNTNFSSGFPAGLQNISATSNPNGGSIPFSSGFDLGVIGDIIMHKGKSFLSLGSLLEALQQDNETTILMTPKVIAQDSKTSTLFFGQNIPFVGSTVANQTANTLTTTNIEYRDVGMSLSITPVLGNNDVVTLSISLEKTATEPNDQTNGIPIINGVSGITTTKTSMDTTVHLPNKNFLVLSGMVTETKSRQKSGIPCLGSIPVIGAAFSQLNRSDQRNNVVIFLRPHIINSYRDLQTVSEAEEESFKEAAGSPILEKEFEEGTEMIKSILPDDQ